MHALDHRGFRVGFASVALFAALAGESLRYSISWIGFAAVVIAIASVACVILVREHRAGTFTLGGLPYPLLVFVALATVSLAWSFYPGATLLGLLGLWMGVIVGAALAIALTWAEILVALGRPLRIILAASIVFELWVSLVVREKVLPFFAPPGIDYDAIDRIPVLMYWSRNVLFTDDKIQGIVGNSSLLGFLGLLALVVFSVQWGARTVGRISGLVWMALAVFTILHTRSATITIAIVVLAVVILTIVVLRRVRRVHRTWVWNTVLALVAATTIASIAFPAQLLAIVGKSPDLTQRLSIWDGVIRLAHERPVFGWGWVSYWAPWVSPFDRLAFTSGVRQLHAHNAWLDVWLQLGAIGVIVFAALMLSTTTRAVLHAADRGVGERGVPLRFTVESYLPALIMFALLVQTVAESRILVEYGIVLLVMISVKTKLHESHPAAP
jgi:hypothetical protein